MDLFGLEDHMLNYHCISFSEDINSPLDEWEYVAEEWDESGQVYSGSETENVEQPKEEEEITFENNLFNKKSLSERHSNSSSDSSSSVKSSKSKSRRKARNVRDNELLLSKQEALKQQNEARFIKSEIAQQQNMEKISEVLENQIELKSSYKSVQTDLRKVANTLADLSAQNNSSETTVKTLQDGLVANTVKICSTVELANQHFIKINERLDTMNEQKTEDIIPPIQTEPVIQPLEIIAIENINLEDSTGSSSVQKRESKDNITMMDTQSNNIIEANNQSKPVSINSESMLQYTGKQSANQKVKILRKRILQMRKVNRMKAIKKNEEVGPIEETDNDDSSSTAQFLIKNIFNFLIAIITGFFNLMNNIINSPMGILWGILALLALMATLGHGSPVPVNNAIATTSLGNRLTLETSCLIKHLDEVQQEEFYGIESACDAIPI